MLMVRVVWLYYVAKFTEFFDTIFFVLRKKFNQVRYILPHLFDIK